jgi:hypothetical protein
MASVTIVVIASVAEMNSRTRRRSVPPIRASVLRVVDPSMRLTLPPAGVAALGGLVHLGCENLFLPVGQQGAGDTQQVLIDVDNNVEYSSSVTIGSIRCLNGRPHRFLVRTGPARSNFMLRHRWHCIRDRMESLPYAGNAR